MISLHMHHAFLNIGQNIRVYSTITHRVTVAGNRFCTSLFSPLLIYKNYVYFGGFSSCTFHSISALKIWQILSSNSLHIVQLYLWYWKGSISDRGKTAWLPVVLHASGWSVDGADRWLLRQSASSGRRGRRWRHSSSADKKQRRKKSAKKLVFRFNRCPAYVSPWKA